MALLSWGIGASSVLFNAATRRVMLVVSVALTLGLGAWLLRKERPLPQTVGVALSILVSLALVGVSVVQHGW